MDNKKNLSEADILSDNFDKSINKLGRITSIIALLFMLGVPFGVMMYYKIETDVSSLFNASLVLVTTFAPIAIVENISYYSILGAGSIYLCSITGNVLNLKLPSAVSGMKIAKVEPGTKEGDVISIISIGVSSIVTIIILIIGLFIGELITPVLKSDLLAPGFNHVTPALLGAVCIPTMVKMKRLAITPILVAIAAFLIIGPARYPFVQSYVLVGVMFCSALVAYLLYKNKKI